MSAGAARRTTLLIGFAALIAGLFPLAIALGWFAMPPSKMRAPAWAVGLAGAFFVLSGLAMLVPERHARIKGLLGGLAVTALAVVFDGIAFGPGDRPFGGLLAPTPSNENAARAVTGLFAVLVSLLALWGWIRWFRDLKGDDRRRRRR